MAYTDAATLKAYLGIAGTTDDTLLTALVTRAQAAIERYTHRRFEAAADTTRKFTVDKDTDGQMLWFDEDCAALTTVKTNADNGSGGETVAATEYVTEPRNRTPYYGIRLLHTATHEWTCTDDPENGIEITGKWAYSETPPADIVHACIRLAAYMYRQKDASTFDTIAQPDMGIITVPQGLPRDVVILLDPYVKRL